MFEGISERFSGIFDKLRWGGKLTADNIHEGLREVRRALLEADVNVQVVREFLERVTAKAVGEEVLNGVQPGQQVVQVVHDELGRTRRARPTPIFPGLRPGQPSFSWPVCRVRVKPPPVPSSPAC